MADRRCRLRAARPRTGFSIPTFLYDVGTVYMIAEAASGRSPGCPAVRRDGDGDPLRRSADRQASESGRLDPPLLIGMDEATQICPIPLPSWLSDSGGKAPRSAPSCTVKPS